MLQVSNLRVPIRRGVIGGAGLLYCELDELDQPFKSWLNHENFDIERWSRLAMGEMYPLWMLKYLPNMPACHIGIRYDVDNVPLTILDYDHSPESRDLTEHMIRSGYFRLIRAARDQHEVDRDLATDASRAAVVIPVDFSAHIRTGEPVTVQAIIDGSDSNTATIAQGYLLALISRYSADLSTTAGRLDDRAAASTPIRRQRG